MTPFADWQGYHRYSNGQAPVSDSVGSGAAPTLGEAAWSKYQQTGDLADLFRTYHMPSTQPATTDAAQGIIGDAAAADKTLGMPHFDDLKNQFAGAGGDVSARYRDFQNSGDISGFAAGQRAADARAAELTGRYADTARGILGEAKDVTNRYRTEGQAALDRNTSNASDFLNKDIPASIADAQARATRTQSLYGRGTGLSSGKLNMAGSAAVRASLPFQLQGRQYMGNALERYQPFYGDVASRDYSRLAGLNLPTETNIYGAQVGDVMRGKATEQQLQSLDRMIKEQGLQAAIANLHTQGVAPNMINDLFRQWQGLKAGSLGLIGQGTDLVQKYAESGRNYLPGSGPVTQPQYFGLPQPRFPGGSPGRYSPSIPQEQNPNVDGGYVGGAPQFDRYGQPINLPRARGFEDPNSVSAWSQGGSSNDAIYNNNLENNAGYDQFVQDYMYRG